ncbi:hypothetical protein MHYP_G00020350 [Metynnis hypsauchen]
MEAHNRIDRIDSRNIKAPKTMIQEHEWLHPPSPPCGCWGGSCFPKLSLFSREDQLLERWRQQESLRQLRREIERERELKERKQKRERKEQRRRKLEERRRQRERERQKEIEMVQWRLQILMEQQRVEEEEWQELQRLRELERELQLKELREREKERKERERQPSTRKALRGSVKEGEIRGMEEIIRQQEMEILRCRERRNQMKREVNKVPELPAGVALKIHWRDNHTVCSLTKDREEKKFRKNNS